MRLLHRFLVFVILPCVLTFTDAAAQISEKDLDNALHSTVLIYGAVSIKIDGRDTTLYWGGSGTVLSPAGWILTNHHVAFYQNPKDSTWHYADKLQICYNDATDQSPIFLYYAEPRDYLPFVPFLSDFALLKCTRDNTGLPLSEDAHVFPYYVRLGDSNKDINVGNELYTIGYPDYAFGSVNCSRGMVTNIISSQDLPPQRLLIGTDAEISAGNSGGAAINREGKLIGVPTWGLHGAAGWKGYILPINHVREMVGAWVPETELGAPVSGRIIDAETGRGIIGALVFVLLPDIKCREVNNKNWKEKTCIWVKTGIDGKFRLPFMLPVGKKYSSIVTAAGYQQKNLEGYYDIRTTKPWDTKVELVRQH
jgi:hypothetical protein